MIFFIWNTFSRKCYTASKGRWSVSPHTSPHTILHVNPEKLCFEKTPMGRNGLIIHQAVSSAGYSEPTTTLNIAATASWFPFTILCLTNWCVKNINRTAARKRALSVWPSHTCSFALFHSLSHSFSHSLSDTLCLSLSMYVCILILWISHPFGSALFLDFIFHLKKKILIYASYRKKIWLFCNAAHLFSAGKLNIVT